MKKIFILIATILVVACGKNDPTSVVTDLGKDGTANCYVISSAGTYKFKAVKGNSSEVLSSATGVSVLWETFGTDTAPLTGDIIAKVEYKDGYVQFSTPSTLSDGNAVIAVNDAAGAVLWSWHIWVCKDFNPIANAQAYNNGAGTMMDRNLGAMSAAKGDVRALGLLYQWGRKDPFPGSASVSENTLAATTLATWPAAIESDEEYGTIEFAIANPTTFLRYNNRNFDWYYSGSNRTDNTRWQASKTIYDPCPTGWRIPEGDVGGVWSTAFDADDAWTTESNWDSTNFGMDFGSTDKKLGNGNIWYPASGYRHFAHGDLGGVGLSGHCWSCSPNGYQAHYLFFHRSGKIRPNSYDDRAIGMSVRCIKE